MGVEISQNVSLVNIFIEDVDNTSEEVEEENSQQLQSGMKEVLEDDSEDITINETEVEVGEIETKNLRRRIRGVSGGSSCLGCV